jgi:hypothetical protein
VRRILASHRWRRRFGWIGAAVAVVVAVVAVILLVPESNAPTTEELGGATQIEAEPEPVEVAVTASERRAVNRTLHAFIATAVTRADPAASWTLVTPRMREGITREEWNSGDLPVVPYPVVIPKELDWTVVTSYPGDLTLDLVLQPKRGSKRGAASFFVEMKRNREGRWLVDSMYAEDVFGGGGDASAEGKTKTTAAGEPAYPRGRLSPAWIAVPAALLALVVLVPVGYGLVSWRRQRAIDRRYRS